MKRWKKFIAMGLAVSMIDTVLCTADIVGFRVFRQEVMNQQQMLQKMVPDMRQEDESGNEISDENNSGDESGTGELKDQEPEQSETRRFGECRAELRTAIYMQLYSDGKLEKTYVIPYADADAAKAPEALIGKDRLHF